MKDTIALADSHHTAIVGGGVEAAPVPYTLGRDPVITLVLVVCFVAMMISVARSWRFLRRQLRNFFYMPIRRTTIVSETTKEVSFQFFLMLVTCMAFSLILFFYTDKYVTDVDGDRDGAHRLLLQYFLLTVVFFVLKMLLYRLTNWVFFDRESGQLWIKSQFFLWSLPGIVLYPVMLAVVYLHLSPSWAMVVMLIIFSFVEILSFYRCYLLFFKGKHFWIQNLLYLCTLEVVPILLLFGSMVLINEKLSNIFYQQL